MAVRGSEVEGMDMLVNVSNPIFGEMETSAFSHLVAAFFNELSFRFFPG